MFFFIILIIIYLYSSLNITFNKYIFLKIFQVTKLEKFFLKKDFKTVFFFFLFLINFL